MIGIYKITNKINGKSYIGKSSNIERRYKEHKYICSETNKSLAMAYKKYGRNNFEFSILEECREDELNQKEIYYISIMKPEYNRTTGGDGSSGHIISENTREILRRKGKEQWERLPKEKKEEILKNNLKTKKGHYVSEKTKEKLRIYNLGKKQSKETILKRKQTIIEKKKNGYVQTNANHKKKVICIETNKIYNSVTEAGLDNNVHPSSITGTLKGKYKSCKGKHFKYYHENSSVTTNDDECNRVG